MQTNTATAALAPSLIASRGTTALGEAAIVLLASLVLVISAKVFVPFFPVPMTLATLAVMAIAAAFGMRLGLLAVLTYLGEGLAGLPVFTYTPPSVAGPLYFLGPTGGFLAGYIVLAIIVGTAADRGWDRSFMKLVIAMVVADAVLFAMGFAWFAWFAHLPAPLMAKLALPAGSAGAGTAFAWAKGVQPFILGDLLKIVLAAAAVPAAWNLIDAVRGKR
jgi:biotin transport system substrate-specific component